MNFDWKHCVLCKGNLTQRSDLGDLINKKIECSTCGKYIVTFEAIELLNTLTDEKRILGI